MRTLMKILSNLFGNNTKINASAIAIKKADNTADTLDNCVIVDSGSNSNGSWIKWADGTMICYKKQNFGNQFFNNKWGTLYETQKLSLGDFPISFIGDYPDVYIMPMQAFFAERSYSASLISWGNFWAVRATNEQFSVSVSCVAIGRWK